MLTREDVERIIDNRIAERGLLTKQEFINGLTVEVTNGDFTTPNSRTISLKFNGEVINTDWFDIRDRDEYGG